MKKIFTYVRSILVLIVLLSGSTGVYASHILGMDLYYTWIGPGANTYRITAVLYGDCGPSSYSAFSTLPSSSPQICIYRGNTYVTTIGLNIQAPTAGVDITPVCPAQVGHTQCENTSSTIPGIKKFVYSATYTLPAPVTSNCWQFLYIGYDGYGSSAGRSASITNMVNASASSIELVDTLNNTVYPNNSNTQFSVIPTPFYCINSPDTYNPGAINSLDSIRIDLVAAMNSAYIYSGCGYGVPMTYTGTAWNPPSTPVSATTPLRVAAGTFSYNSATGQLNFNPNATQRSTVVYNVREFRNGNFVGSCQREMNFLVQSCTHTAPAGAMDSVVGGSRVDSVHFTTCANSGPFNLYFDPREPGSANTITITSSGLPSGSSLNITGNGTTTPHATFSWTSTGVTPGTYIFYLTYTDNNCPLTGTTTQAITIVITPAPTVTFTVVSPATCVAKEVFTIIPGGTGSPWNVNVTGTSTPGQAFTGVTGNFNDSLAPGIDTIWISSAAGSTCNSHVPIVIGGPLNITISYANPTVCAPANGSFTVSGLTAGASYNIFYTVGGTPTTAVMTANGSGQIIVSGLPQGSYTNVYVSSSATGCVSNILSFTLTAITITITGSFTNPTVCTPPDGTITLSGLTAGASYTVYYTQGGTPQTVVMTANGSGQVILTGLPPVPFTGVYVVSNANGCQSNVLTFNLVNPSNPPQPTLAGGPVCADSILFLTASDAVSGLAYNWSGPNGFATSIQNPGITNAQTIASGLYTVTVVNTTTGCSSSNTLNVLVKPTPTRPNVTGNNPCESGTLSLGANSTPAGCTYSWNGPGSFGSGVQNPVITPANIGNSGTYTVVATLNGCLSLPGIGTYVVYPIPPAPLVTDSSFCQGAAVSPLTATGANDLWYTVSTGGVGSAVPPVPSDSTVGIQTWYVTQTVNGCESPRAPVNTTILYVPVFNIAGNPSLCLGASTMLYYSGPPLPGATYLWSIPGGDSIIVGNATKDSILVQFNSSVATQYVTLTASDYNGRCTTTETIKINVSDPPLSHFYIKPDICVGDTVLVALADRSPSASIFTWDFDGAMIIASNSNSGGPYSLSWLDTGIHRISLVTSTDIGCTTPPVYDSFNVHGLPDASIAPPKSDICLEDTVMLSAVTNIYKNIYQWTPAHYFNIGEPVSNNGSSILGIIQAVGDVTLTVTDPFGCVASTSLYIDPNTCCAVGFPNAFTPNGDGHNDVFRPIFKGNHTYHIFRVVNRWGQTIFETSSTGQAWDGTFNGVPQDMGVYYYYLKYDCEGKTMEAKGDVTLIR